MAFKPGVIKLPFLGRNGADAAETAPKAATPQSRPASRLPLIGRLATGRQLQILTILLVLLLAVDAAVVAIDTRQGTIGTIYIATVGKIRMLSQRLAKAAQQASQGNAEAFKQLRESRDEFAALVKLLMEGGSVGQVNLPASPDSVRPALDGLDREWKKNERNASLVIAEDRNLVSLGQAVRSINASNPTLQELADEIFALSVQSGGSARQNANAAQLMMLTQRMAKNANNMLAEAVVDPEVAFLLGKDTNTFRNMLQGLLQGSEALRIQRVADADLRGKLGELDGAFKEYQRAVGDILGNQQRLVNAKRASFDLFNDSEALLRAAERLNDAYGAQLEARQLNIIALAVVSVLALITLLLIGKVYLDDSRRRAEESERQNKANQEAILRLLDEIGNLADGDLTVRAKVTEDITGAIADSINYTIDELRRLVTGINNAAQQVTVATEEAQTVTGQLLQAAQRQVDGNPGHRPVRGADDGVDAGGVEERRRLRGRGEDVAARRGKGRAGGAERDPRHERHPRADPGDVEAHQAPGRKLAGDRRDRAADLGHHRADQRAGAERRDPGGLGRRSGARLHRGRGGGAAAGGALRRRRPSTSARS